jgi:methionine sulfoxide reductase heme-binding subunit
MSLRPVVAGKGLVWILCLSPLARLVWLGTHGGLTANPIEFVTLSTGTWTLVFLLCALGLTPLRRVTGWNWPGRFRRLVGLFAFFWAFLHFTTYIWLDKFFDLQDMLRDVTRRRFITAGLTAFLLMVPLAATSTVGAIRRMGGRAWRRLHRLVYFSAIAAVIHFWWKVKADVREPAIYAAILALLLLARVPFRGLSTRSGIADRAENRL